ncbi:MAG: DUF4062 domain-containing protein [Flavobacteriaceae bacterium]
MKIFLASRFKEFENLREILSKKFKEFKEFKLSKIELIDLNDGKADYRDALQRSIDSVNDSAMMVIFVGDTYSENIHENEKLSITHLEYKTARENGINILPYYIGRYINHENFCSENDPENLKEFKREVFPDRNSISTYAVYNVKNDINKIAKRIIHDIIDNSKRFDINSHNELIVEVKKIFNAVSLIDSLNPQIISLENERYKFKIPISLIKKMYYEEWALIEHNISKKDNEIGLFISGDNKNGFFIELNKIGKSKSQSYEINDDNTIIRDILINCDSQIENEYLLFRELTLKQRYFYSIFKDFSHNIEYLIESDKFPSSKKKTLLFRLLALYYYEKGNYDLMRENFASCINLLEKNSENKLSGFFIGWAEKERELENIDKANEIYKKVIDLFNRPNSKARFNLAVYYKDNNESEKAVELFKDLVIDKDIEAPIPFYESSGFWQKFEDTIADKIKYGESKNATKLQDIIKDLAISLNKEGELDKSEKVLLQVSKIINNNDLLTKALINFYIKNDITKATKEITLLSKTNFNKFHLADLWLNYYKEKEMYSIAFDYVESFLKENHTEENIDFLYRNIGDMYHHKGDSYRSSLYYNKIVSKWIYSYDLYAMSLIKYNETKSLRIFKNYFHKTPYHNSFSRFTKNISRYVILCLKNKKHLDASKLINQLIKDRKVYNYEDGFFSFLHQQQLKLTADDTFFDILLKKSEDFSKDNNQKAIVYSNFAKHLIYKHKPDFSEQVDDYLEQVDDYFKSKKTSISFTEKIDIRRAITLFKKSLSLKKNPKISLEVAKCYFELEEFDKCTKKLNTLLKTEEKNRAHLYLLKISLLRKDSSEAYKNLHAINDFRIKQIGYFEIAKSEIDTINNNIYNYEKSIKNYNGLYRKLSFSIYLYSINNEKRSREVLEEINKNPISSNKINLIYHSAISVYQKPLPEKILISINNKFKTLMQYKNPHKFLITQLNTQIKKFPLNDKLYSLKFKYYFILKDFNECEKVLQSIIDYNLINRDTSSLFFSLSRSYYNFSNLNESKTVKFKKQVEVLIKASRFIKYALIGDERSLEYKQLYSIIFYKQGLNDKHKSANKEFVKGLSTVEKSTFFEYIVKEKNRINIHLYPEVLSDYFTKVEFYNGQEKTGATLLGKEKVKDSVSYIIYKSIEADNDFHKENCNDILNRIRTRLATYHFDAGKKLQEKKRFTNAKLNYSKAFFYQKNVYKSNGLRDSFIGSFLATIQYLEEFEYGIKICEMYLKTHKTAHIFHKYGNFLREKEKFESSFSAYDNAIDLADSEKHLGILNHNMLRLCYESDLANKLVIESEKVVSFTKNAYNKVLKFYPTFEYIEDSLKYKNYICDKYDK